MKNLKTDNNIIKYLVPTISSFIIILASYYYKNSYSNILRNEFIFILGYVLFLFSCDKYYFIVQDNNTKFNNNRIDLGKFWLSLILIVICLLTVIFPLFSVSLWLYPSIFVILNYFIAFIPSVILGVVYLSISCLLSLDDSFLFVVYFISSISISFIFNNYNHKYKLIDYLKAFVINSICLALIVLFYLIGQITIYSFIFPLINVLFNCILIFAFNNYFLKTKIADSKAIYDKINDWNNPLLQQLKNDKPISYMRSVHISHYVSIISKNLNLDSELSKAGSSYSCIYVLFDNDEKAMSDLFNCMEFPNSLCDLLNELYSEKKQFTSIESFTVSLCKTLVFALLKIKDSEKNLDSLYEPIVNSVFSLFYKSQRLQSLDLSFSDFEKMKKIIIEDKMYLKMLY